MKFSAEQVWAIRLFSSLKLVNCWLLEESNPGFHRFLGNKKTVLRRPRISVLKPPQQLIRRHIQVVHLTARPQLLRPQPIVFAFLSGPKAEVQDDIRPQLKRATRYTPEQRLDSAMPPIVFWFFRILTKKGYVPLVDRQSKRRQFVFELSCQCCFA